MQDRRQGVALHRHLAACDVDVHRLADENRAEVEGAGEGGDDHRQGEGGAVVGAGEVGVAGDVQGAGAGAEGDVDAAYLRGRGAGGVGLLLGARLGRGGGEGRLIAVGDAGEAAEQARRRDHREARELLGAVLPGEVEDEGRVGAGLGGDGAGVEGGFVGGPCGIAGAGAAVRAGGDLIGVGGRRRGP